MDEWVIDGREAPESFSLSFARTDRELCFNRIRPELRMPEANLHFPKVASIDEYSRSFDQVRCVVMQGGQGEVKHWAFNDPPRREGQYRDQPPSPAEYRKLRTRVVDLHPMTIIQNARTSRRRRGDQRAARRRSASARSKPGRPKKSRSGRPARTTTRSACG